MNNNIPFGRENKTANAKYREFNEEYENALAYDGIFADRKVHNTTKDNTKWAYNGEGIPYKGNKVRIPSIKRSNKIWKNFYTLFAEYYNILQKCLSGELKCIKSDNYVGISIPSGSIVSAQIIGSLLKLKIVKI